MSWNQSLLNPLFFSNKFQLLINLVKGTYLSDHYETHSTNSHFTSFNFLYKKILCGSGNGRVRRWNELIMLPDQKQVG